MRLRMPSNPRPPSLTRALTGLSLLLAAACGGALPPEEAGDMNTRASLLDSCSPDVTPPVVLCQPETDFMECVSYGYIIEDSELSSLSDNCGIVYVDRSPVAIGGTGTYETSVYAVDAAHNGAGCSTRRRVIDSYPPTLTLNGPTQLVLNYGSPYVEQGFTGTDTCDGDLNRRVQVSGSQGFPTPGIYPFTYSVSDQAGHLTQRMRLVTVLPPQGSCTEQLSAPVLALQGLSQETLECGRQNWQDPGALAADACGAVTVHSYNSGQDEYGPGPNSKAEGNYQVQYLAWNGQGTTSALRTVTVRDSTPPRLQLQGGMHLTHTCGSAWVDPGYTAVDDCYGDVSSSVQTSGSVNGWAAGTYTVTYQARDPGGHLSNLQKRTVDVVNCPW